MPSRSQNCWSSKESKSTVSAVDFSCLNFKLMFVAHSPYLVILSEAVQSTAKSKDLRTENLLKSIENA